MLATSPRAAGAISGRQAGSYATWTPTASLTILAELWAISAEPDAADRGFSIGADIGLPTSQRLLVGWGKGLASGSQPQIDDYAYLGLMTAFGD